MLRGPVQASFPTLETFPREAGTSGHVYPFSARSASPMVSQTDSFRLPSNIATATFWRSPYSEARHSKSSLSKRAEGFLPGRDYGGSLLGQEADKDKSGLDEKECEAATDTQKNDSKDSGSELFVDNVLQLRGILCKSSLSCSSRQSGPKVQKRVKFDDTADKGQSPRQSVSASCGRTAAKQDCSKQQAHRSLSASPTAKSTVRMPSLPHAAERQQQGDSTVQPSSSSSPTPSLPLNPHQYPHIPRANSGPLIRTSSVSELTLPRPTSKSVGQNSYHLMHSTHNMQSPTGPGSSSSHVSPTALDFRIYRQPPMMGGNSSGGVTSDGGLPHSPFHNKGRFFATHGHSTGTRSLVRLSRSFTSPAITLHHPVKRPIPSSSSNEDLPLSPPASGVGINQDSWEKSLSARDVIQAVQAMEEEDERRGSFLDDDKTVQILHWLNEVGHRQAREGRCPVFASATCRDA